MKGFSEITSLMVSGVQISFGITLFEEDLFWTQFRNVLAISKKVGDPAVLLYESEGEKVNGIKMVHPSKQPIGWSPN